jgi:hypothetical protein
MLEMPRGALAKQAVTARHHRVASLSRGGVPEALARRIANLAFAEGRARHRPGGGSREKAGQ